MEVANWQGEPPTLAMQADRVMMERVPLVVMLQVVRQRELLPVGMVGAGLTTPPKVESAPLLMEVVAEASKVTMDAKLSATGSAGLGRWLV